MRGTITALLAGLLLLPALTAADKPAAPAEQLEALKKEIRTVRTEFGQAYQKAKTAKEKQELRDTMEKQLGACARRALELARKHPKDPVAVDALCWIIVGVSNYHAAGAEIETAFDLVQNDYVTSDKIGSACGRAFADGFSRKPEQFLRAVIAKNPHRDIQAVACFSLARLLRSLANRAERLRDPEVAKEWEKWVKADVLKHYKNSDPEKLLKETEELLERVVAKYGDVKTLRAGTYGKLAEAMLFEMRHLVIGKPAPEIEGEDIDGKHFKLSDYRGKVVVLDFWGHW